MCLALSVIAGCSRPAATVQAIPPARESAFYVFRLSPPAMLQLSNDERILRELPLTIPDGCSLDNVFAPPVGETLAIEFSCSFGQAVVWFDTQSGRMTQPVTESDSYFLAWAPDGQSAYLKVATMSRPHIVRASLSGKPVFVPITELTYDVSPKPGTSDKVLFSFSRGMNLGSEMWLAMSGGQTVKPVVADAHSYISFARWSPDGSKIAFIKIPDTATPFTVGELWVMDTDGSNARKLADVDAGHGCAEAWSPNGSQIAFVVRENPGDAQADQDASALKSNISVVDPKSGVVSPLTHFPGARVEAPTWSPDESRIAFTAVVDDKMSVYLAEVAPGQVQQALSAPSCCAVWTRK